MKIKWKNVTIVGLVAVLLIVGIFFGVKSLTKPKAQQVKKDVLDTSKVTEFFSTAKPAEGDVEDYRLNLATISRKGRGDFSEVENQQYDELYGKVDAALGTGDMATAEASINALAHLFDKKSITSGEGEMTYAKGILIANKKHCMPYNFSPGEDPQAKASMNAMIEAAGNEGIYLNDFSTYRGAEQQENLFNRYAASDGEEAADRYSSRPGCSDHQTGMAFDIGGTNQGNWAETSFDGTTEAVWLENNAQNYGFILRYPQGKEEMTGYMYESWHYRYVGDIAPKVKASGLSLEEYLGIV